MTTLKVGIASYQEAVGCDAPASMVMKAALQRTARRLRRRHTPLIVMARRAGSSAQTSGRKSW